MARPPSNFVAMVGPTSVQVNYSSTATTRRLFTCCHLLVVRLSAVGRRLLVSLLPYRINCLFSHLARVSRHDPGIIGSRSCMPHPIAAKITGVAGYVPPTVQTNTDPAEIDLIVLASVTPDMFFPAIACLIQERLGAKNAWGFDLSAACSGFVYALTVGAQFVGAGTHKKALIIGSDKMTSILDYKDRATCVLFGDGAGAVLVEPSRDGESILDFTH